jgi:CubicO group peptidase (beta-lactamase class C family)
MIPYTEAATDQWTQPPAFPSGSGGLVSIADDYLAFSRMMLNKGKHDGVRMLSGSFLETMTTDQLTPQQKAVSGLIPGYFDSHGWGFGVSIVTRRISPAEPADMYGWNGGLGTLWNADPKNDLAGILLTQRAWTSPRPPDVCQDFGTLVYGALDN